MQKLRSFKKPQKRFFERTFRYLGYSTTWSLGLFLFTFYILSAISFLTDSLQTANFNWLWLVVSGLAFLPPVLIGLTYRFLYLERSKERSRPWLNLLVAGLAGSSRNLSVGVLSLLAHLDNSALWSFRFFGGFFMGISVYSIWSFLNGAKIEYLSSLRELSEIQSDLSETRNQMPSQISSVNERLQERTRQALLPQLGAIKDLLGSDSGAAVDRLRFTITEQIRPMMKEIAREQPKPFNVQDIRKFRNISGSLPNRFTLHDKFMVTWSSVIEMIGLTMWILVLNPKSGLIDVVALFGIYFSMLSIFKLLLPKERQFNKVPAIMVTIVFAMAASAADVIYIYYFLNFSYSQFLMLAGFAFLCGIVGPVTLLQVTVRTKKRAEIEGQIKEGLLALAKENSLFAQRLWVFRKRWLLVLHGNVQSALTAAITRLQSAKEVTSVVIQLVNQDLVRARKAIDSSLSAPVNLTTGILELQAVWEGICDLKVSISERAKRALDRSDDTSFCVNEILKEAVSNAVRHGEATEAEISIDRVDDDVLQIEAVNNGKPGSRSSNRKGIGSELLDEVCLSWELTQNRKNVRLFAELAIKL